jgi:putative peptidoglycan lipid II flippase
MNQLLNRIVRYLALVIPFSILLLVLRHEVIFILFQRGHFDAAATELTAQLLPFLLIGAFAFSAQTIVVRGYYAMQDTLFPAIFGTVAVALSIPFFVLGMRQWGPIGVALGVSFSAFLQVWVLYALWNRRSDNPSKGDVYRHVAKMVLMSVLLGIVLEGTKRWVLAGINPWTVTGTLLLCLILGMLFLALLILGGWVMNMEEISSFFRRFTNKDV